ncbi:peptidylprolyl isomerase [Fodinibius saliphilus]|uniref:peptidylprolyl isomerase n=1 Tax=Fodinibius saliphilus TaxID=1920650 RepID=UPI00110835F3|nr:peptidylprolyl isomerase [Fodinibius saliphilus]
MRYTKLRTWAILVLVLLGVILILNYSGNGSGIYKSQKPITDSLITKAYPNLYKAIAKRDINDLEPFLSHKSPAVRAQAWRAVANTPVDSLSPLIALADSQSSGVAWFAISNHKIEESQIRSLEIRWEKNSESRPGISRVLGRQGDEKSLQFLLNRLNKPQIVNEYHTALAVGRLINRNNISAKQQLKVIETAFSANDPLTQRAYFYGWYRGDSSRLTTAARDTLYSYWQALGSGNADIDQYINKILPERTTAQLTITYNGKRELNSENQLAVELAKSVDTLKMTDKNSLAAKILLTNKSPHVQVQTIKSLKRKLSPDGELFRYISESMLPDQQLADIAWLQALKVSTEIRPEIAQDHQSRLQKVVQENPYLWPQVLAVYQRAEAPNAYLDRTKQIVNGKDTLAVMHAVQALNHFWDNLSVEKQTEEHIQKIRSIVFQALALQDEGIAVMTQPLIRNEKLFNEDDFSRINQALLAFSISDNMELYQAFGSLYKDRFENQAGETIDSLATLNIEPLSRSLASAGWDIELPEKASTEFRFPNWDRLWELGAKPVWTLKTEKGPISIRLNTLSAPATVSMIDSLSRVGAYDGVPFHRVVPNFVIQGGDIEHGGGFGGTEFVIPTEASEHGFVRGAAGIASAGTDTEGSQYFIMHQWKPHLNGGYTKFGKVIDGFRYIDRIVVGDKVNTTSWEMVN